MTRINIIPPAELCDQHLLAEHRELTRIPNLVAKGKFSLEGQPSDYKLGTGHVKFFFDKMQFFVDFSGIFYIISKAYFVNIIYDSRKRKSSK